MIGQGRLLQYLALSPGKLGIKFSYSLAKPSEFPGQFLPLPCECHEPISATQLKYLTSKRFDFASGDIWPYQVSGSRKLQMVSFQRNQGICCRVAARQHIFFDLPAINRSSYYPELKGNLSAKRKLGKDCPFVFSREARLGTNKISPNCQKLLLSFMP
jgi:hypothetical protein